MKFKLIGGYIEYNEETKCFSWVGEMANDARHKFNKIQREHNLTEEVSNRLILEELTKNKNIIRIN